MELSYRHFPPQYLAIVLGDQIDNGVDLEDVDLDVVYFDPSEVDAVEGLDDLELYLIGADSVTIIVNDEKELESELALLCDSLDSILSVTEPEMTTEQIIENWNQHCRERTLINKVR